MSQKMKPIILYDIPSIIPGRPWSSNTMKTRYCLTYKGLSFTTVWVELPDIAGLLQSKGIKQSLYTLPTIEDPNTGAVIMDSLAIATYLDDTYPETPKVLSPAAHAALEGVGDLFSFGAGGASRNARIATPGSNLAARLVFPMIAAERLNPVSREYFHRVRAACLGDPELWTALRDACSAGPEVRAERVRQGIDAIRGVWRELTALYDCEGDCKSGPSHRPFVLGEEPSFLDFAIAGRVKFILDGLLPSEVEIVRNLEGGRLARLEESLEKYYKC